MSAETRTTSSTGGQKGSKIERYDLVPPGPLRALATHFGRGAAKYADNQWRKGYPWSLTISALMRHLEAFREGLDYDVCSNDVPEACSFITNEGEPFEPTLPDTCYNHTGSHHVDAVMWHSFVLREFIDTHPEHDDRYVPPTESPAEEEARLLEKQLKLDRNAMWVIPEGPTFHRMAPCHPRPVFFEDGDPRFAEESDGRGDAVIVGDHEFDPDVVFTVRFIAGAEDVTDLKPERTFFELQYRQELLNEALNRRAD